MCDCHACHIIVHRAMTDLTSNRPVTEMSYEDLLTEYQALAYLHDGVSSSQNRRLIAIENEMEKRPEYKIRESV